jgi:hypothetical protein
VISGHGVVYAAVPLALGTYCPLPSWRFGPAMLSWLAVIKLCIQVGCLEGCSIDRTHTHVHTGTRLHARHLASLLLVLRRAPILLSPPSPNLHIVVLRFCARARVCVCVCVCAWLQETVDKTHYSVDMLLAVVLTALVWHWQEGLYPPTALPARPPGSPPDPLPLRLVALVLVTLVVVFVGVSGT